MFEGLTAALRRRVGLIESDRFHQLEKRLAQVDKKIDQLAKRSGEDRLVLRRLALIAESNGDRRFPHASARAIASPAVQSSPDASFEISSCPMCGSSRATLVCEYNRFVLATIAPDDSAKVYNYSLCHGCGIVYAARRPVGRRLRQLLTDFHENLGRTGKPSALLNPSPLTDRDREDLRRRTRSGALVSEHTAISNREWLPGALRDRLAVAPHIEILSSLLELQAPRVLEVRSRTGAILEGLRRLYHADVYSLPVFESQQEIIKGLYDIPAIALVDFEHFTIPYDGAFDLIVSNHMLTHSVRPIEFLEKLSAALAPGGHVYFYNEMDEAEVAELSQSVFHIMNPFHMQLFTAASMTRALAAAAFEPVFLLHTDAVHIACLARKAPSSTIDMPEAERLERLNAWSSARDLAILKLPAELRRPFEAEWERTIERAVLAGLVTLDERGRLNFLHKSASASSQVDPETT